MNANTYMVVMTKKIKYCECGCGTVVKNRFVRGHQLRVKNPMSDPECRLKASEAKKGRTRSNEAFINLFKQIDNFIDISIGKKIQCNICGAILGQLSSHLSDKHNMTIEEYKNLYPDSLTVSQSISNIITNSLISNWLDDNYRDRVINKDTNKKKSIGGFKFNRENPEVAKKAGKKRLGENNGNYGKGLPGELNGNWKGGITTDRNKFMGSEEYRKWRISVFERDNYTCQQCGRRGGDLNCHHILPYSDYPEYSDNINNGITLCVECHYKTFKKEYDFVFDYLGKIFDNKGIKIFGDI